MPERETIRRARKDAAEGKAPTTQAGEFVREEIEHIRKGKHGARSSKQAIAIGLSKARRAGVKLPPPDPSRTSKSTRRKAQRDTEAAKHPHKPSSKRSSAIKGVLKRESRKAGSRQALSRQARNAGAARGRNARSTAAKKAVKTRKSRRSGR
jgi:Family of unknown function (DUF6496)